jgi:hypothetical protein
MISFIFVILKSGEKPMTLKEYHNKMLQEGFVGEEDDEPKGYFVSDTKAMTYNEEQEALKNEIKVN